MYREIKVKEFPVARDGVIYFCCILVISIILVVLATVVASLIILSVILWIISILSLLTGLFIVFFFRNPKREVVVSKNVILSPADGKVLSITEIDEPEFIGGKAINVSIFLSLFNVHINRSPIEGTVRFHHYREGQMLPAFKSHASDINERNTIGIESTDGFKMLVHQITGFVARRIVWWVKPGDALKRGERFGLIRFGSCTQIVVPIGTQISVIVGQKVHGGITIMGEKK